MEGHGIRMMVEVFGGIKMIIGCLVSPLLKEVLMDILIWVIMKDVFQKYQIKNGNLLLHPTLTTLIGMMLETKSKSDVAINQKVNRH